MQQPSYFAGHPFTPAPQLPEWVVLEGGSLLKAFRERVRNLPVTPSVEFDEEELMRFVFGCIAYEKDAELALAYDALEIAQGNMGMSWSPDVDAVVTAAVEFGTGFFRYLRSLKLYEGGYLFYHFYRWLGPDIVLQRMHPPALNF